MWNSDVCPRHYAVNSDTIKKCRCVLAAIFKYAIAKGAFPAKSNLENPAHGALIPTARVPKRKTKASSYDEVKALLAAFKKMPLERAAIALCASAGTSPAEARGLRWSDWDRAKQHIQVQRNYWHTHEGTVKAGKRERLIAVTPELREILLALWKEQGSPLDGWILAAPEEKTKPVNLDNLANRTIRPRLKEVNAAAADNAKLTWPGWYAFRRFHGTEVCDNSNLETTSRALGNSKEVANKHYVKPAEVPSDVRKAVNAAVSGLTA